MMTAPARKRIFVVGGYLTPFIGKGNPEFITKEHADFGKRTNPTLEEYIVTSVKGALRENNVDAKLIDRAYIGNFAGELFNNQGHLGAAVAGAVPEFRHLPCMRVEGACASGGLAVAAAVDALSSSAEIVLAVGAEVQTTVSARQGADFLARAAHYRRQALEGDFTFPALFAARTKAYMEKYGVSEADIGRVAVKAYANGNKNSLAHMKTVKMDLDTASKASNKNPNFLKNATLKPFLKNSDASQVSDGAAAMVLANEEGLKKLGRTPENTVEIVSLKYAADSLFEESDPTRLVAMAIASQRAYKEAGITAKDIKVAEVHDCFAVVEVLATEALGFAEPGKGTDLLKKGETEITGRIPVNTGGGLLAFGHPVGATGIKQILEIQRQMLGRCGDYQIKNPGNLTYGLAANMGGDDKTVVVTILRNNPAAAQRSKL